MLPKELLYLYHSSITKGLENFDPEKDECGYHVGIGYIMQDKYK